MALFDGLKINTILKLTFELKLFFCYDPLKTKLWKLSEDHINIAHSYTDPTI